MTLQMPERMPQCSERVHLRKQTTYLIVRYLRWIARRGCFHQLIPIDEAQGSFEQRALGIACQHGLMQKPDTSDKQVYAVVWISPARVIIQDAVVNLRWLHRPLTLVLLG